MRVGVREFETVLPTRGTGKSLHNFRKFSEPPWCVDKTMLTLSHESIVKQLFS